MLEYVLFSKKIRDIFVTWLQENQIEFQLAGNDEELLVLIDENIDEDTEDKIEQQYDLMLDESAKMVDEEDDPGNTIHLVGIQFTHKNGNIGQVAIPPEMANQIQRCLSASELQAFVQLVADAVNDPENKSLCQY